MVKKFLSKYLPQIVAMLFLAGFAAFAAWQEPSQPPPQGNVEPPVNTGSASQVKAGALGIGGVLRAFSDLIVDGKVGIGTTNPQGLIDVGDGKLLVTTENIANFTAGPNSPGIVSQEGGTYWGNISGSLTSNNNYASITTQLSSNFLKVTGFNFSIPSNAIIDGIQVEIERYAQLVVGPTSQDSNVLLVKAGAISGFDRASSDPWPTTDTNAYKSYGGSSDKWGLNWLPIDINNPGFGVAISVTIFNDPDPDRGALSAEPRIDHIRIKVFYHTGSAVVSTSGKIKAAAGIPIYSCPDMYVCNNIDPWVAIDYHTCDGRASFSPTCQSTRNQAGACPGPLTAINCSFIGWIVEP